MFPIMMFIAVVVAASVDFSMIVVFVLGSVPSLSSIRTHLSCTDISKATS